MSERCETAAVPDGCKAPETGAQYWAWVADPDSVTDCDERVRLVRGAVQIVTGNQRGTELQVRVPLDAPRRVQLPAD